MQIRELNGFYYVDNPVLELDWLSDYDGKYYFVLNNITKALFIRDILPLIEAGVCMCTSFLKNKIINFIQAPTRQVANTYSIIEPDPENKPLKEHQREAVSRMIQYPRYGFFLGTGTGKTLIAISFLLTMNIKTAIIVTPKKVISQYKKELDKYIPNNNFIVTNYEQLNKYTNMTVEALILDESHRAKNYTSNISMNIKQISRNADNVYLFTGTPQDKQRHEIIAQLYLLYDHFMPGKTKFIHRYFNLDDYFEPKSEKKEFSRELIDMIESITWGKETDDVLDLSACPEKNHIIECEHPGLTYSQLIKDRLIEYPNGSVVVADSKAILKIKLREICSGFVRVERGEQKGTKPLPNTKIKELAKLLISLPNSIIYTEFKYDIKYITEICDKLSKTYVVVDGSTRKSAGLIEDFKQGKVDYLIIQNRSGNAGLDLTCTNNIIFYSLPESYIVYHQCKGRIRRPGQTKECNYYHLICKDTIEKDILNSLRRKKSFTTKLFKVYQ